MDGGGYLAMLCIETGNIADDQVSIAVGEEYCLSAGFRVEKV